jgi:hypothetical protein
MVAPLTPDEIVAALKRWHVPYRETPGWRTRANSRGWGDVTGFMWHHTGDDAPDGTDLRVVTEGRAGLPGPLCNFGLADDGTVHLVAAGAANHAGGGDARVLAAVRAESYLVAPPAPRFTHTDLLNGVSGAVSGNPLFYGCEAFYYNTNSPKLWATMPLLAAAIIDALDRKDTANKWTAKSGIGHKEWQRGKVDPRTFGGDTMATLRAKTQRLLDAGPPGTTTPNEELDMAMTVRNPLTDEQWSVGKALWSMWTYTIDGWKSSTAAAADAKATRADVVALRTEVKALRDQLAKPTSG